MGPSQDGVGGGRGRPEKGWGGAGGRKAETPTLQVMGHRSGWKPQQAVREATAPGWAQWLGDRDTEQSEERGRE